jgi:hypothetical protein
VLQPSCSSEGTLVTKGSWEKPLGMMLGVTPVLHLPTAPPAEALILLPTHHFLHLAQRQDISLHTLPSTTTPQGPALTHGFYFWVSGESLILCFCASRFPALIFFFFQVNSITSLDSHGSSKMSGRDENSSTDPILTWLDIPRNKQKSMGWKGFKVILQCWVLNQKRNLVAMFLLDTNRK